MMKLTNVDHGDRMNATTSVGSMGQIMRSPLLSICVCLYSHIFQSCPNNKSGTCL